MEFSSLNLKLKKITVLDNCSFLQVICAILIVVALILYIFVSTDYFKGLSIGLLALFLTTLTVDSILHYRLKIYLEQLEYLIT